MSVNFIQSGPKSDEYAISWHFSHIALKLQKWHLEDYCVGIPQMYQKYFWYTKRRENWKSNYEKSQVGKEAPKTTFFSQFSNITSAKDFTLYCRRALEDTGP